MKILVTGGTGLIGAKLVAALSARGDEVVILTRNRDGEAASRAAALPNVHVELWPEPADLPELIAETDAIFNLAGEPIFGKRWTPEQRQLIHDSRVRTTETIFEAARRTSKPPSVIVNASAVGYYGAHGPDRLTEADPPGTDFLAEVCREWEAATNPPPDRTRVVRARIGVVLEQGQGALAQMVKPFQYYGGGPIGNGSQYVSWIHIDDMVGMLLFALDNDKVTGAVNMTSPEPVTNKAMAKLIGQVLGKPSWLPVPKFALKFAFGDAAEAIASGQRVLPDAAMKKGYKFKYPECEAALRALLGGTDARTPVATGA